MKIKIILIVILILWIFSGIIFYSYSFFSSENIKVFTVIPHHNLADKSIGEYYDYLKKTYPNFENIVIISPNHFFRTNDSYISFPENKKYCYQNNNNCINWEKLSFYTWSTYDEKVFNKQILTEHWIWNHFQFINKNFPKTKVFSILLKIQKNEDSYLKELEKKILSYDFKWNTLFIASVDFSHHVNEKVSIFHDIKTVNFLNWINWNIEVDCPNCLYLIKNLANKNNEKNFQLFNRTSVDTILKINSNFNNTTHIYWEYTKNKTKNTLNWKYTETKFENIWTWNKNEVSMMFFWDTHFTRDFTSRKKNFWIENYLKCFYQNKDMNKKPYFWHNRMFYSFDFVWVNLETSIWEQNECQKSSKSIVFRTLPKYLDDFKNVWINIFGISNNHSYDCWEIWFQATKRYLKEKWLFYYWDWRKKEENILKKEINWTKVAFVWFNDVDLYMDKKIKWEKIKKLKEEWYLVILNIHWWTEYNTKLNKRQQDLARTFIDYWANIIIWHHPHVTQEYEIYKWVPIFYSLWNFIFDQPFPETLPWLAIAFSINWDWIKFNVLNFKRDEKTFMVDCDSFK